MNDSPAPAAAAPPAPASPPASPALQSASVESLADEFLNAMPAAPAAAAPAAPVPGSWAALRDRFGNPFNPALHQVKADGSPVLSKRGRLMALPGVRPPGTPLRTGQEATPSAPSSLDVAAAAADGDGQAAGGQRPAAETAPALTEAERDTLATEDAETIVDGEEFFLDLLTGRGALAPTQREKLKATARRGLLKDNIQLPIGAWFIHMLTLGRVTVERADTDSGKARLTAISNFLFPDRGNE